MPTSSLVRFDFIRGVFSVVYGFITAALLLAIPNSSSIAVVFGIYAIIDGLIEFAIRGGNAGKGEERVQMTDGIWTAAASILAAVVSVFRVIPIHLLIGIWALGSAVLSAVFVARRREEPPTLLLGIPVVIKGGFGLLLLFWYSPLRWNLQLAFGAFTLLFGLATVIVALSERKISTTGRI